MYIRRLEPDCVRPKQSRLVSINIKPIKQIVWKTKAELREIIETAPGLNTEDPIIYRALQRLSDNIPMNSLHASKNMLTSRNSQITLIISADFACCHVRLVAPR